MMKHTISTKLLIKRPKSDIVHHQRPVKIQYIYYVHEVRCLAQKNYFNSIFKSYALLDDLVVGITKLLKYTHVNFRPSHQNLFFMLI